MLKKLIDYLVQDLDVQANVAVTIILSLFTFSLGFIITWTAAAISKCVKRWNYRKSLKIIVGNFLNSCQQQYLSLEKFVGQKGFSEGENIYFSIIANFGQNYLSTLDIKTFIENFSSFRMKNRAKEIADLFQIVENIKVSKETFKEQVKVYYTSYEKAHEKYNENLDGLRKLRDDLALEYNAKPINKQLADYISSIAAVFTNWTQNGANTSINATNTEIVLLLFNEAKANPPNAISRKVLDYCIQCRISVESISNCERYIKEEIDTLMVIHKDSFEKGTLILNKW